jgi:Ring finger domain
MSQSNISYRIEGNSTIFTLSDRGAYAPDGMIQGLFYVPNINTSTPCYNLSSQYLPQNVTRMSTIPNVGQYALIGVAPWISDHPECALPYMQASQVDPSRGLVFFPTRSGASINTPIWNQGDWGVNSSTWTDWVTRTDYPIWAIPSDIGATLVQEMGKYSGNASNSPYAKELLETYPREDAVRLLGRVALNSSRDSSPILKRLWVFAIMILAILCVVTGLTSVVMHINQRRMRRDLRRRIANGEVDLEVLGIKRQKVPQKLLDKMPLYIYTSKSGPLSPSKEKEVASEPQTFSPTQRKAFPKRDVPFSQPTCPICLDDFEHNDTIVRELPCQHIFHPECVDEFLRTNSSLCPMCKKSALPQGYCPENITISMVRRERMIRRMREDGTDSPALVAILPQSVQRFLPAWLLRIPARPRQGAERPYRYGDGAIITPRTPSTAVATSPPPASPGRDVELGALSPTPSQPVAQDPPSLDEMPPEIQALSPEERREWGRQRLAAALPPTEGPAEEENVPPAEQQRQRGWRRLWKRMFPS